jgi:hypothetical protein
MENLYLKVAASMAMIDLLAGDRELSLNFLKPLGCRVTVDVGAGEPRVRLLDRGPDGRPAGRVCPDAQVAVERVLELRLPFRCLGVVTHAALSFIVALSRNGTEIERHPRQRPIELNVPDEQFPLRNWTA